MVSIIIVFQLAFDCDFDFMLGETYWDYMAYRVIF